MQYNYGDSDLEILYDSNTKIEVLYTPDHIEEYPVGRDRFPPFWKPFKDVCRLNSWEKNLGIVIYI